MWKRWVLARRPQGRPRPDDFRLETKPLPEICDGEALVAVDHFSVDPGMRTRLTSDSYAPALGIGELVESAGVGRVVRSRSPKFKEGDTVWGGFGWQSHVLWQGRGMQALDPQLYCGAVRPTDAIGIMANPGLTAYFGLIEVARIKPQECVLISSAAGQVGATAGQIAKILGATAIGIAGGPAKCAYLRDIGFDATIDYRASSDLSAAIKTAAPGGADVFFDNVGGAQLDAAIATMRERGRIVISGQVAEYNSDVPVGIRNVSRFIPARLSMQGFVVYDYAKLFSEARTQLAHWIRHGKLTVREHIVGGIEHAPDAFAGLFEGRFTGRVLVAIGH